MKQLLYIYVFLQGNFAIFYMLAKYVPGNFNISDPDFKFQSHNAIIGLKSHNP
jgi:hypothetical protein